MPVWQAGRPLHVVSENQFLDSPEWFGVTTDEYFQVSVTALEECSILVWHRDRLKFHLMADSFLQVVFDHVLGRDVVKKLMQVGKSCFLYKREFIMTRFENEVRSYCKSRTNLKVVKWG